jgi:glutamyl-tRNA synthetase
LRTALFNWLAAQRTGGDFLLRFDDTDAERSRPSFAQAIVTDLEWVGIRPAGVFRQSERITLYEAAADRLKSAGRLYPCFESPQELEAKRQSQRRRGLPPVYDRSALELSDSERRELVAAGHQPHWRFLLGDPGQPAERIDWDDTFRGRQQVDLGSVSDPILVREDGTFLYTLPSVVDDIDMGITHIIRGEDHTTNTAVQIALFKALGAEPPTFGHHNLLTTADGEGLSKRTGSQSVASMRNAGYEPMAVATLATLIGTSAAIEPMATMSDLARAFEGARVSRAAARFDLAALDLLNARLLHVTPFASVADRLADLGVGGAEPFWLAVRANCTKLDDAARWWRLVTGPVTPPVELAAEGELLTVAADLLPDEPWDDMTFAAWMNAVRGAAGKRGRALFHPIRLALTGLDQGPELAALLPLIGRSNTLDRLAAARHP